MAKSSGGVLFISWAEDCSRSDTIALELGGCSQMVYSPFWGSSYYTAFFKYLSQSYKTLRILFNVRPDIIYVMTPPTIAALPVWVASRLLNSEFVLDAHTGAFLVAPWNKLAWLHAFLSRRAAATLVTNQNLAEIVASWGADALIIPDVPVSFSDIEEYPVRPGCCLTYVSTFTADEPLEQLIAAARMTPDVTIYVTGDHSSLDKTIIRGAPNNLVFTGFLSKASYGGLIQATDAVICLTKLDFTMQRGAYEAIYAGKPVVTSDFEVLQKNFPKGAVFVDNEPDSIASGIRYMRKNLTELDAGAKALRQSKLARWNENLARLRSLS